MGYIGAGLFIMPCDRHLCKHVICISSLPAVVAAVAVVAIFSSSVMWKSESRK